ncbi:MAG: aminotransferase class I/II-fold pyridoxal phosphate-dependent enzyme [Hyphomicrobiaceae bacterium]
MPLDRLTTQLRGRVNKIRAAGPAKGAERVISAVVPAHGQRGPRFALEGHGDKNFLRMNANAYLGLSLDAELIAAEELAVRAFGTGPGAVRFISGTWTPHKELERRLARFHGREAAMLFSSAYAAVMGVLPGLITPKTAVISDALNHNCIINAIRLSMPKVKQIYTHVSTLELEQHLAAASATCDRAVVVSDGVFSMRGDHAPLDEIMALARRFDDKYAEGVIVVVDDSHGVGALGPTGRGTEEITNSGPSDILLATLGKALGVNGGYVVSDAAIIDFLRETSPFYIYSNPITPGEAAAAVKAIEILDSPRGLALLAHLRDMTAQFEQGLVDLGLETIRGPHPVTPLMVRDTPRTQQIVDRLFERGVLATGLGYPVVPKGDEEIRFQICADLTNADIREALEAIRQSAG